MKKANSPSGQTLMLKEGWSLQSSASVPQTGGQISLPGFKPEGWHPASVPTGVVAALVENKVYPDPNVGMNLRKYPGMGYPMGENFFLLPSPQDSPFAVPWWFRKEFKIPKSVPGERAFLHFDGINYQANIWVNGQKIAGPEEAVGAYPHFVFDITSLVKPGQTNALALEISVPTSPKILAFSWADWHPCPPDKNLGIWRDVYVTRSGPVVLDHSQVTSALDLPSLDKAHLTVAATLTNATDKPVQGLLKGAIEKIRFSQSVELGARETKTVVFEPSQFKQLNLSRPRLWWPFQMGKPEMYNLKLELKVKGKVSDKRETRFGIRQMTSELIQGEDRFAWVDGKPVLPPPHSLDIGDTQYRLFKVNGKPILIRGAGWAPNMLFKTTPERAEQEVRYVRDMNLNAIRFEGSVVSQHLLDLCDQYGILVMTGWTCCSHWERWDDWTEQDHQIARASMRSEIRRLINHPCVFVWVSGSDYTPPEKVLRMYRDTLGEERWPNPHIGSARGYDTLVGKTGVKMRGPYQYVPPSYWYLDKDRGGGTFGFNTETSPGPSVPPVESIKKMIPPDHLWPIDEFWDYHCCGEPFNNLSFFNKGLESRYGSAKSLEEYVLKAQVEVYDGHRAMFEAYGKNKYHYATGVIQWMLNNGWPSFYWHLYDYYLQPGSAYFASKKANEDLHVQYSYDDGSIVVINNLYKTFKKVRVKAKVYQFDLTEKFSKERVLDIAPDSSTKVFSIAEIAGLSPTCFVKLDLEDFKGKSLSTNFYWLSTKKEAMDQPKWFFTPTLEDADMTLLNQLPKVKLAITSKHKKKGKEGVTSVTVKNPSKNLAFFIRLKLVKHKDKEEVLPILWQDNYFSLMPGEKRQIQATYLMKDLQGAKPLVEVEGWNLQ